VKRPASELLKKDLIKKPILDNLPKKDDPPVAKKKPTESKPKKEPKIAKESEKSSETAPTAAISAPVIKKPSIPIKKAVSGGGGGGLAASLAKIKS
jgi:hypothetical protein